jgi:fluoride exporter
VTALLVAAGAAVGGIARYAVTSHARRVPSFPGATLGTAVVNVLGCLMLGALTRWHQSGALSSAGLALLGVGFCCAFTTWSAFALDSAELVVDRRIRLALTNLAVTLFVGLAGVAAGWWLAGAL